MAMFGGTAYPPSDRLCETVAATKVDGWIIPVDELQCIARALPGTPVTFDHTGLMDAHADPRPTRSAIELVGIEQYASTSNPKALLKSPVGRVKHAFVDRAGAIRVVLAVTRGVSDLIKRGIYTGLSLSHYPHDTNPVEVSVTPTPGRPGCYIDAVVQEAHEYNVIVNQALSSSMATTTTAPMDVNAALNQCTPEVQESLKSKLVEITQHAVKSQADLDAAQKGWKAAEEQLARLKTSEVTEQDFQAVNHVLSQFLEMCPPQERQRYGINSNMLSKEQVHPKVTLNNMERLICACNAALSRRPEALSEEVGGKRRRTTGGFFGEAPEPVAAPAPVLAAAAPVEATAMSSEKLLAAALAAQFDVPKW